MTFCLYVFRGGGIIASLEIESIAVAFDGWCMFGVLFFGVAFVCLVLS